MNIIQEQKKTKNKTVVNIFSSIRHTKARRHKKGALKEKEMGLTN